MRLSDDVNLCLLYSDDVDLLLQRLTTSLGTTMYSTCMGNHGPPVHHSFVVNLRQRRRPIKPRCKSNSAATDNQRRCTSRLQSASLCLSSNNLSSLRTNLPVMPLQRALLSVMHIYELVALDNLAACL